MASRWMRQTFLVTAVLRPERDVLSRWEQPVAVCLPPFFSLRQFSQTNLEQVVGRLGLDLDPDGLIAEERDYFDTAALLGQLGAEPSG